MKTLDGLIMNSLSTNLANVLLDDVGHSTRTRRGTTLGQNEQFILLALRNIGGKAYGSVINNLIESRTGRALSVGVLYNTIDRLAKKGLIEPVEGDLMSNTAHDLSNARHERRRYFTITGKGASTLEASLRLIDSMRYLDDIIDNRLLSIG